MKDSPVDRFPDKVSGACIIGAVNRFYIVQTRHHQHGNVLAGRPVSYLPAGRKAVHLGHDYVQQHNTGFAALKGLKGFDSVRSLLDHKT